MILVSAAVLLGIALSVQANNDRIIGGSDVGSIEERPFMVQIIFNGGHFCGGSIIGDKIILTAAHCCTMSPEEAYVRAGSLDLYSGEEVGLM